VARCTATTARGRSLAPLACAAASSRRLTGSWHRTHRLIALSPTVNPDRVTFQVERLAATENGRVEVRGRWFGVRGRRFVRPTLTLTPADGGLERRWLADLEHKPWAAQDGEPWTAAFPVDVELDRASAIELSVAPDIEIALRAPSGAAGESSVAARARSPLAKQNAQGRRPSARAQALERLSTRLSSVEAALERERERRAAVDAALEEQRAESRRLSAELGRARAELDLAHTVQRESEAMSAELDSTRRQLRAAERRHEALAAEHERATEVQRRVEAELRERSGALESARDALEQERARPRDARPRAPAPPRVAAPARGPGSEESDRLSPPEPARPAARRRDRRPERDPVYDRVHDREYDPRPRPVAPHRIDRPVNPALRPRPNWMWRVLALLVIAAVVVAVSVVLHSTILQ
jgi:hypothetical protein